MSFSGASFIIDAAFGLQMKADEAIIGATMPVSAVSPYSIARRLSALPQMAAEQAVSVFLPLSSELHAQGDINRLRALYLSGSLRIYDALTQRGIGGFFQEFQSIFTIRAPLITALPAPFYFIFGRRWHAAFLVNLVALVGLFSATFLIGRRWWGLRAGLLAVAIVGSMPLMYGLARWFLVDYALTAMVAIAVWLSLETDYLKQRTAAVLFGITCGLGLLLKVSFAIFLLPVAIFTFALRKHLLRGVTFGAIRK